MKRYEPYLLSKFGGMDECEDGDWVRYEDAKKVVEALSRLVEFSSEIDTLVRKATGNQYLGESPVVTDARSALKQIKGE